MTPVLPVAFQHTGAVSQMVNIGPFSFLMQVALVRVELCQYQWIFALEKTCLNCHLC